MVPEEFYNAVLDVANYGRAWSSEVFVAGAA
jgi:hypothetical protein